MAQKVMLIDDLDGSEGAETIRYSVDGQEYEIDLSEKNAERFRSVLKEFVDASREVEQPPTLTSLLLEPVAGRAPAAADGMTSRRSAPGLKLRAWRSTPVVASRRRSSRPTTRRTASRRLAAGGGTASAVPPLCYQPS